MNAADWWRASAASLAFFHGFETASLVAAGVAAIGAILAWVLIPARPASAGSPAGEPAAVPAAARS